MITTNPPFQVLVTKGNQALLAAGNRSDQLKPGQLGIFDYSTGLSITATTAKTTKRIFFAVGKSSIGSTTVIDDVQKSTAEYVEVGAITSIVGKDYVAPVDMVITYTIGDVLPETDYGFKIELRNQETYSNYGYNTPYKYMSVRSGEEADPATGLADTEDFIDAAVIEFNNDPENLFTATKTSPTTFTVAIRAQTLYNYVGVNLKYANPRGTFAVASTDGFGSDTTFATTTELKYEQGAGYDIKQLEYVAGGWNGNPGILRASTITGFDAGIAEAVTGTGYGMLSIGYRNHGVGADLPYQKDLLTYIVSPEADATAIGVLKTIATQLGATAAENFA
jgi:hypothetical protein